MNTSVIVFGAGAFLIGLVAAQLLFFVVQSFRAMAWEGQRHERWLQLLDQRIEAARALGEHNEKARFAWNGCRKFVIERKVNESRNVCSFYLVPHDRKSLPAYQPGQFLTFQLNIPGQDKPVVRCYSLSDVPGADHYRITVKKVAAPSDQPTAPPGLVSNFFCDQCQEGDILDVKAPGGNFVLDLRRQKPAVLIAGGVGITPLLSMAGTVAAAGASRRMWLFYGVHDGGDHTFREPLNELSHKHENIRIITVYSAPREQDVEGQDYQHSGHINVNLLKNYLESNNYEFYICGPPPMMKTVTRQLADWGVPKNEIFTEAFGAATVKAKKAALATATVEEKPHPTFKVKFAKCNKELVWDAKSDNLLEFGEVNNVPLEGGCRAGNCGTCEIAVVSGKVAYNQKPEFSDLEEGCCLACIGFPTSDIVLDA